MNESSGPSSLFCGAGRDRAPVPEEGELMALLRRQRETATVLLLEKPLAEDPDHGESARHEPFQEALCLGAAGWAHG